MSTAEAGFALQAEAVLGHRQEGEGPEVLLLNGGLMSFMAWEPWAQVLRRDHRLLRCDLRGQLLSPGPVPLALAGQADELLRLLDHCRVPRAHVVGASYGAFVAMVLAARHPSRVASLVLITAADHLSREVRDAFLAARRLCAEVLAGRADGAEVYDAVLPVTFTPAWREGNAELIARRRAQFSSLPAAYFSGLDGLLAAIDGLDLATVLPLIHCPTLVIGAEQDVTFPLEQSRALAEALRDASLAVVPGAPHGAVLENAEEVLELVAAHLRRQA